MSRSLLWAAFGLVSLTCIAASGSVGTSACPTPAVLSCAAPADTSACCTPSPGLFVFKQRFDPEVGEDGQWGIEGLDVLECETRALASHPASRAYTHEEIASVCLQSDLLGSEGYERAERDWAQSEVGEGVEEVWERSWNSAGRYVSTLAPDCLDGGDEVPLYFSTLQRLHGQYDPAALLAEADIIPSDDTTYTLGEILAALSTTNAAFVTCNNDTLSTVHWPLQARGAFQDGDFEVYPLGPSQQLGQQSECPEQGIRYLATQAPRKVAEEKWDPIFRPKMRPITKTHDESRRVHTDAPLPGSPSPIKLSLIKRRDEGKDKDADRRYHRDEL